MTTNTNNKVKNETSETYNTESTYTPESNPSKQEAFRISCSRDGKTAIERNLTDGQKSQMMSQEIFGALLLNNKNEVLNVAIISIGTLDECCVNPKDVFRRAIVEGAARIMTFHNHPSGDTTPSPEDKATMKRLSNAGDILGIAQLDSLIVSPDFNSYVSLRDLGYI